MNWDDPVERFHLIERVGVNEYNRLHAVHMVDSVVDIINGHSIRSVQSRFGRIFVVDGTNAGSATIEGAREIARKAG